MHVSDCFIFITLADSKSSKKWQVWTVVKGGMTSTLRMHLEDKHSDLYPQLRDQLHLKHAKRDGKSSEQSLPEAFTMDGFRERLTRFIASDDQVHVQSPPACIVANIHPFLCSPSMSSNVKSFGTFLHMSGVKILKIKTSPIIPRQHI